MPKTGGTSIEKAICGFDCWNVNPKEKHITPDEAIEIYGKSIWDTYIKFTVVRNPWDRILSLWNWVKYNRLWKEFKEVNLFSDYVNNYQDNSPAYSFWWGDWQDVGYDYIIEFKNIQRDILPVFKKLGVDSELPHMNKYEKIDTDFSKCYDENSIRFIAEKYPKLISTFGYKFSDYV